MVGQTWPEDAETPTLTYGLVFRYDSARARYLVRRTEPDDPWAVLDDEWYLYEGDEIYMDYYVSGGNVIPERVYPGFAQGDYINSSQMLTNHQYVSGDQIGSTRRMTNDDGTPPADVTRKRVYTAFGELISSTGDQDTRYGYAGEHGYQEHGWLALPAPGLPFLHVGARYYDPSIGRFLQRDPIGLAGGLNLYGYVHNSPLLLIDASGLLQEGPPAPPDPNREPDRAHLWEMYGWYDLGPNSPVDLELPPNPPIGKPTFDKWVNGTNQDMKNWANGKCVPVWLPNLDPPIVPWSYFMVPLPPKNY